MRIWDWDQLLGKPGGARINWGVTNTLAYTSFSGEKQKANEETGGAFRWKQLFCLWWCCYLAYEWPIKDWWLSPLKPPAPQPPPTSPKLWKEAFQRRGLRSESSSLGTRTLTMTRNNLDCTRSQSCKPLGKTSLYGVPSSNPLTCICPWTVSIQKNWLWAFNKRHWQRDLPIIKQSESAPLNWYCMKQRYNYKKSSIFTFHTVSVFSSTCTFITNNINRDLM